MTETERKFWSDILIALDAIAIHLKNIDSFEKYAASLTVKDAVERRLIIIGEAVNKLVQLDPDALIEEAQQIRAFRNRLVHSYDTIDDAVVWTIINLHLPTLRSLVEGRLRSKE